MPQIERVGNSSNKLGGWVTQNQIRPPREAAQEEESASPDNTKDCGHFLCKTCRKHGYDEHRHKSIKTDVSVSTVGEATQAAVAEIDKGSGQQFPEAKSREVERRHGPLAPREEIEDQAECANTGENDAHPSMFLAQS